MQIELNKIQELLEWMKTKIYLNTKVEQANKRFVKRGQVYNCYFGIGVGSEIQKLRPCVILQNNIGNAKSGNVLVAPVTHTYKNIPEIVKITTQYNKNGEILIDGYANMANITCVSKARLGDYITIISTSEMKKMDIAMAISLDLMRYYARSNEKLKDKLEYIQKIKEQRNYAQDELESLQYEQENLLNISGKRNIKELEELLEKYRQIDY